MNPLGPAVPLRDANPELARPAFKNTISRFIFRFNRAPGTTATQAGAAAAETSATTTATSVKTNRNPGRGANSGSGSGARNVASLVAYQPANQSQRGRVVVYCKEILMRLLTNIIQPAIRHGVNMAREPAVLYDTIPLSLKSRRRLGSVRKKTLILDLDETLIKCTTEDRNQRINTSNVLPRRGSQGSAAACGGQSSGSGLCSNFNSSISSQSWSAAASGGYSGPALFSLPVQFGFNFYYDFTATLEQYERELEQQSSRFHVNNLGGVSDFEGTNRSALSSAGRGSSGNSRSGFQNFGQGDGPGVRGSGHQSRSDLNFSKVQRLRHVLWVLMTIMPKRMFCRLWLNLLQLGTTARRKVYYSAMVTRLVELFYPSKYHDKTEFKLYLNVQQRTIKLNIKMRPHVSLFLKQVSKWYDVVIFTAAIESYANAVCDKLETHSGTTFSKRFFRQHCDPIGSMKYTKDLLRVSPDLANVFIVDNSDIAYKYYPDNAISIDDYLGHETPHDEKLLNLLPLLDCLRFTSDVRNILHRRRKKNKLMASR